MDGVAAIACRALPAHMPAEQSFHQPGGTLGVADGDVHVLDSRFGHGSALLFDCLSLGPQANLRSSSLLRPCPLLFCRSANSPDAPACRSRRSASTRRAAW